MHSVFTCVGMCVEHLKENIKRTYLYGITLRCGFYCFSCRYVEDKVDINSSQTVVSPVNHTSSRSLDKNCCGISFGI